MKREITIKELAEELKKRVGDSKNIDCCKEEILKLAEIASSKIGSEKVQVNWKE